MVGARYRRVSGDNGLITAEEKRKSLGEKATGQQRRAANPLKSVWVQASAGTGKTKVLSDRVLRILLAGGSPSRILCLTYTKAAAVEMSSRISARLSKWAVIPQKELYDELEKLLGILPENKESMDKLEASARRLFAVLLDTPGGVKIQTIHSFCQEILKRFPIEAHISPYFDVMDDRASLEALNEIKKHLLQKIENEPDSNAAQALSFLTKKVSEFSFPKILNAIAGNRNKISRLFSQYRSLDEIIKALAERFGVSPKDNETSILENFAKKVNRDRLKYLQEAWFRGGAKDNEKANKLAVLSERGISGSDYSDYRSLFLNKDGTIPSKPATNAVLLSYPEFENDFAAEAEMVLAFDKKLAAVRLLESTKAVLFLAEDLIKGYNHFKSLNSKMDYEDLIVLTRTLLENPAAAQWVLFKLDGGIDNVLIDEAQDTSPDQWAIIKALTGSFFDDAGENKRTVFAVGDRKQSIYSFQGADPREFERMKGHFSGIMEGSGRFDEVNLEVSFRSTAAILGMVNNVFRDDQAKDGVVPDGEDITHIPFRAGEGGKTELWPLIEPEEDENQVTWLPSMERSAIESTSSRLARQIAERIKNSVESGELLVSQNRPIRYRDFMVLVQRRNSFVEDLVRACKNAGVNIAGVDKIKLREQIAVQDLISLGRFLLLPTDDLTLAEVLKSPLFGLDDDDLFRLCYNRGQGVSLWARLGSDLKYSGAFDVLKDLSNRADYVRPFELYAYVLNKLKGRQKFVARLGFEAEDGIDEFLNLTINFEQEHVPNLQGFIDWIAKDEVEIKRELEQSEADAVRVMTVHGSKGLQSPVVVLPDTVRIVSVKNEGGMLWDDLFYYPLSSSDYEENCLRIKEEEKRLALQEYRRLLYVALTRAEDRLCICGYYKSKKSKPKEESWYKICEKSLQQIGELNSEQNLEFRSAQEIDVKKAKKKEAKRWDETLPKWAAEEPKAEDALARPLTPSKMDEEEPALVSPIGREGENRYRRGMLIHKLLQFLPESENENRLEIIKEFLEKNAPELALRERERIGEEVMRLIESSDFASVFGKNSKAEVPIMGMVDGRIISGQVDRLVIERERVLIVDYKTNRPAARSLIDVPAVYLKQMAAYKGLLKQIYPDRDVKTLILWTDTASLMEI